MKIRHSLIIVLILVLICVPLSAQNYLFQDDQSGFHLKCAYSDMIVAYEEYNTEVGYTINGRLTLGLNYSQMDVASLHRIHFAGAGIDYLIIKQKEFPLSISLGTSYKYSKNIYNSDDWNFDETTLDTTIIHEVNLKMGIYRKFDINTKFSIIPSLSLTGVKRYFKSSAIITPNTPLGILSLQTDLVFRSLDVFGGVDFYAYPEAIYYWNYRIGIGIFLKHKN